MFEDREYFGAGEYEFPDDEPDVSIAFPEGEYLYDEGDDAWYLYEDGELYDLEEYDLDVPSDEDE